MNKQAFSLVELSIVLVILGLLVGGILAGQSLIRASELRSVTADADRYRTAVLAFRDKYFAIPGDMLNATTFWGKDATNCNGDTGTANATTGTCNGDGNGQITHNAASAGATAEQFQAWRQLAFAGLVEGNYTGIAGPLVTWQGVPGTNIPRSRVPNGSWMIFHRASGGGGTMYGMTYNNMLEFGAIGSDTGTNYWPTLTPQEAWNIDTKLDDGKPAYGRVIAIWWNNLCSQADAGPGSSTNSNLAASYRLDDPTKQCAFVMRNFP